MASRFQFGMPRQRDGWTKIGGVDITTTAALVIVGAASMVVWALFPGLIEGLAYSPGRVRGGEIWRLVTWPIANVPSIWSIITLAFFWFIGNAVEDLVGRQRFLRLMAAMVIVPTVVTTALPMSAFPMFAIAGLSLLASATFVIFAAEYPQMPFFFGIPAWVLAAVFVGIDFLQMLGFRMWGSIIHLAVMIFVGLFAVRQWGFATQLDMIPRLGGSASRHPSRPSPRRSTRRAGRRSSKVVAGPWGPPNATSPSDTAAAQAELDDLLDKISAGGLDSLTDAEKRRLNELSKRLR